MTNVAKTMGTVLFISVAAGCGGGGSPATVSDYCTQRAVKECGTKGSGGVADNCGVDANTQCKPARIAVCMAEATTIQQQSGTSRPFNSSRVSDCLDKTAEVYAKATIVPADRAMAKAACDRVFSGSKKAGDVCSSDFDCGGALVCDLVCAPSVIQMKGEFCGRVPGAVCGPGLYCGEPAGQPLKMCIDLKNSGEICDPKTAPCLETLRCLADSLTCGARAEVLEPCTSNDDCAAAAPYCDPFAGNTCDPGFRAARNTPECADFGAPI